MNTKRALLAAVLVMVVLLTSACSPVVEFLPATTSIYATFYPLYALTQSVAEGAENTEIHCLIQPQDDCLRSYALSDWDIYMLAYSADAVIAAGNGLESFSGQLEVMGETALPLIEVAHTLDAYEISGGSDSEDGHFTGSLPYQYLSVYDAAEMAENIEASLSLIDNGNAHIYEANMETVLDKLTLLQEFAEEQTDVCSDMVTAVLNEALFYPAQDCGLQIETWFERESGEMLYGKNLQECIDHLKEHDVELVLIEQQAPKALVDALEDVGFTVARLNTMSTLSESDGVQAYFDALEDNISIISAACSSISEKLEEFD